MTLTESTSAHQRLLAWPVDPVPVMYPAERWPGAVIVDGVIGNELGALREPGPEPPGELFLELVCLDLEDEEQVLGFVHRAGPLRGGFRSDDAADLHWNPDWPDSERNFAQAIALRDRRERTRHRAAMKRFAQQRSSWRTYYEETQAAYWDGSGSPPRHWEAPSNLADHMAEIFVEDGETLVEFRSAASDFRDLYRCYSWLWENDPPKEWESAVWDWARLSRPRTLADAAGLLATQLTKTLEMFGPKLALSTGVYGSELARVGQAMLPLLQAGPQAPALVPGDEEQARNAMWKYGAPELDVPVMSAYDVCCLQLFNHIISGQAVQVCANPDCTQLFVKGYRRDGVLRRRESPYCDESCGDLKRKRDERRRKRDKD